MITNWYSATETHEMEEYITSSDLSFWSEEEIFSVVKLALPLLIIEKSSLMCSWKDPINRLSNVEKCRILKQQSWIITSLRLRHQWCQLTLSKQCKSYKEQYRICLTHFTKNLIKQCLWLPKHPSYSISWSIWVRILWFCFSLTASHDCLLLLT